jgi:hypothetical protein
VATLLKARNLLFDWHLGLEGQVWNVQTLDYQTWQILELETFGSRHHYCYPESPHTHISIMKSVKKSNITLICMWKGYLRGYHHLLWARLGLLQSCCISSNAMQQWPVCDKELQLSAQTFPRGKMVIQSLANCWWSSPLWVHNHKTIMLFEICVFH